MLCETAIASCCAAMLKWLVDFHVLRLVYNMMQTSGASIGLIAGAVIAGIAAMLVALALFTTYRRRRSTSRHVYFKPNPVATDRVSG